TLSRLSPARPAASGGGERRARPTQRDYKGDLRLSQRKPTPQPNIRNIIGRWGEGSNQASAALLVRTRHARWPWRPPPGPPETRPSAGTSRTARRAASRSAGRPTPVAIASDSASLASPSAGDRDA